MIEMRVFKPFSVHHLAVLPIPLFALAIIILWIGDERGAWTSSTLNWFVHCGSAALAIAFISLPAALGFLATGQVGILMLGSGIVVFVIGAFAMPLFFSAGRSSDAFAIYNLCALLSALCHFIGMAVVPSRRTRLLRPKTVFVAAYGGAAMVAGFLIWMTGRGVAPAFFIAGHGGTLLRAVVVSAAAAFYILTSGILLKTHRGTRTPFLFWYSLGLILLAVGLTGSLLIVVIDSPLQWATRLSQYCGVAYMCVAVLISIRRGDWKIPIKNVEYAWRGEAMRSLGNRQGLHYGAAIAAVAISFGVWYAIKAWFGQGLPEFLIFYPAVMVIALWAGFGPGLLATVLAVIVFYALVVAPVGRPDRIDPIDRLALVLFCLMGLFICIVAELYRRSRIKAAAYDREEALRATRREKEFLAGLLEHAEQPFIVSYPDGRVGRVNRAFERLTGYSADELRAIDSSAVLTPPQWRETERRRLDELHVTGRPVRYEKEFVRKDGSVVPVEILVHLARDAEGKSEYYYSFLTDIAERRRAEESLRESEERYRTLVKYAPAGIYEVDFTTGRLTEVNDVMCRILGYSRDEFLATSLSDLFDREGKERFASRTRDALAGKHLDEAVEYRVRAKDGHWVWTLINVTFHWDDGRIVGASGVAADITERKRVEEELRKYREELERLVDERTAELRKSQEQLLHSQKMEALGQLAGGIAHDFNNMMQVVMGFTHRTLRALDFENPLRENLKHIQVAAKSAAELTHQLLAFSRRQILQPQVLSLNELILNSRTILHHTLGEDIEISYDLQPGLDLIKADPTQIEQAIINMAVNARHAMPAGGKLVFQTVNVTLSEDLSYDKDPIPPGPYVMLSITDTGCGMGNDILEKIFEPFFTTRPFGKGSGLGLSTAYGTIRQSGGVIRVDSEPSKGTTFRIYLPRTEEALKSREIQKKKPSQREKGKTILAVEDNDLALEFVVLELADMGHFMLTARNAEEAYSISRSHRGPIHLLLTDVVLPGASGWDMSKILSLERPEMATLYMSGYDADHVVKQGKLVAGAHLLVKPFSSEQLAAGVSDALNSKSQAENGYLEATVISEGKSRKKAPMRILVVDDDPGVAAIIAYVLRKSDRRVESAEDGATAIKLAADLKPDVVLLDIKLPDMDGYELSRRLREMSEGSGPFIIAVSGYAPEQKSGNEAFDAFCMKPVDFKRLEELITSVTVKERTR